MKMNYLAVLLVCTLFYGCTGVKFADAPVNKQVPEAFTQRSVYPGGIAGYDFQDLVGNILFIETSKDPLRIDVIRPTGYVNAVIPITDSNNFYRSRIQKGAEAQGSYLAFAANFSSEDMAELTLDDIARAGIELKTEATWTDIKNKIIAWVKIHPKTNQNTSRLWVKSVVLSRRVYNSHSKIDANASGQVGDVTGVKTGVYKKDEEGIKSVMLGFEAFDVDKLASEVATPQKMSISSAELFEKVKFTDLIEGKIRIK
jgi:hypothetical protein